jgi:hypothetical protein
MTQLYFEMNEIAVKRGFVTDKYLTKNVSIRIGNNHSMGSLIGHTSILSYADRAWAVTKDNKITIVKDRTQALNIAAINIDMKELMWIMLCSKQA